MIGRPRTRIDLVELEKLANLQATEAEIAAWFGVSTKTIERRRKNAKFLEVMERGKAKGRVSLRRYLWKLAGAGNVAACIFLAKNLLGYRDVINAEHSGAGGGPIEVTSKPALDRLSTDELQQLRAIALKVDPGERDRSGVGDPEPE